MRSRVVVPLMLAVSLLGIGATPSAADEVTPSPEFGTHASQMTPEHPLEHGAMFGECVSTMAIGGDCPHH